MTEHVRRLGALGPRRSSACSAPPTRSRSRRSRRASGSPRSRRSPPGCRSSPPTSTSSAASCATARARCSRPSATPRAGGRARARRARSRAATRLRARRPRGRRRHTLGRLGAAHERVYERVGSARGERAGGDRHLPRRLRRDGRGARAHGRGRRARDAGGDDGGFMPTELLFAGLASCFALALGHAARRDDVELPGLRVDVRAERAGRELRYERVVVSARRRAAGAYWSSARRASAGCRTRCRRRHPRSSTEPRRSHDRATDRHRRRGRRNRRRHRSPSA